MAKYKNFNSYRTKYLEWISQNEGLDISLLTDEEKTLLSILGHHSDSMSLIYKSILEKNYPGIFTWMEKCYIIDALIKTFIIIPDHHKYKYFITAYINAEYGLNLINRQITDIVKKLMPQDIRDFLNRQTDSYGYISIYRGESSKSTDIKKALSWTLNREVAIWFAKRFNFTPGGTLYSAKVKPSEIIAYTHERKENEVLARYKSLSSVSKEIILINQ